MSFEPPSPPRGRLDVTVVGGGISGLAAVHRILELQEQGGSAPLHVRLLESSTRLGGNVRSEAEGECVFEVGPDSFVTQKPSGLDLCRRLGLASEVLEPRAPGSGTWILHRKRLLPLPDGLLLVAPTRVWPLLRSPLLSPVGKLRALAEPWIPPRSGEGDESIGSFVRRRFGEEMASRVAEPLLGGLYTADVESLSVTAAAPRLVELERRFGSLTRALRSAAPARSSAGAPPPAPVVSLRGGMQTLIDGLRRRLPASWIETGAAVERVCRTPEDGVWTLTLRDGRALETTAVILALPAWSGAAALSGEAPELARALDALDYASCATASLLYRRAEVTSLPGGFGFFVPRGAGLPILACSFSNRKFDGRAPDDTILLRVFLGGALHPTTLERDDQELLELAHASVASLLGIGGRPLASRLFRLPRAMPQFDLGELDRRRRLQRLVEELPGLFLCGSPNGAFGLPDCIRSGEEAAEETVRWVTAPERLAAPRLHGLSA